MLSLPVSTPLQRMLRSPPKPMRDLRLSLSVSTHASFSSLTDVGSHNPLPFRVQRPHSHSFSSPIEVGLPNSPSFGASVLAGTPPRVHPFRGSASSLACHLVSGSDTIYNSPNPLADIVLFELSLSGFSSRFLECIL